MRLTIESQGPVTVHIDTDGDDQGDAGTGYSHDVGSVHLASSTDPVGFDATPSPGTPRE